MTQALWRIVRRFLKKLKIELPFLFWEKPKIIFKSKQKKKKGSKEPRGRTGIKTQT